MSSAWELIPAARSVRDFSAEMSRSASKAIDSVLPEPEGGAQEDPAALYETLDAALTAALRKAGRIADPAAHRRRKFAAMGERFLIEAGKEEL